MKNFLKFLIFNIVLKTILTIFLGTIILYLIFLLIYGYYGLSTNFNYFFWLTSIVRGQNLFSDYFKAYSVYSFIWQNIGTTLSLIVVTITFSIATSSLLSNIIISFETFGKKPIHKRMVRSLLFFINIFSSFPVFVLAYLAYIYLNFSIGIIMGGIIISLGSGILAELTSLSISFSKNQIKQPYVKTAYLTSQPIGYFLPLKKTVMGGVFMNTQTVFFPLAIQKIPIIVGEAIIIETIFNLPGLGKALIHAIVNVDFPVVMTLCFAFMVLTRFIMILSDLVFICLNPYSVL